MAKTKEAEAQGIENVRFILGTESGMVTGRGGAREQRLQLLLKVAGAEEMLIMAAHVLAVHEQCVFGTNYAVHSIVFWHD